MRFIEFIFSNHVLNTAAAAWTIAQLVKGIFASVKEGKFTFERFFGAGGMPSSHGAFVAALVTAVLFKEGWQSTEFAISVVLAFIVVYDASGVRYEVGQQAKILNTFNNRIYEDQKLFDQELKEYIGHTKAEVLAGCSLGIILAVIYYCIFMR